MKTLRLILLISFVVPVIANLQAKTIRIPGDYSTIQEGVNASVNDDIILVSDGTYSGDKNYPVVDFKGKQIVVMSENGPSKCILKGGDYVVNFSNGETNKSILKGFTITGADPGSGINCYNSSPTIVNNIITKNWSEYNLGAVHLFNSSAVLMNNLFYQNEVFGDCAGIVCYSNSNPKIFNNTFIGALDELAGGAMENYSGNSKLSTVLCDSSSKAVIVNCIFVGTGDFSFNNCSIKYSLLDKYVNGVGNIVINPDLIALFILSYSDDLMALLNVFSAYVAGKGTLELTGINLPDYDIMGNKRILNSKVDIGAIESYLLTYIDNVSSDGPAIYPNPVSENFLIRFNLAVQKIKLEIFNTDGKLLLVKELNGNSNFMVSVKGINSGLYLARITSSDKVYFKSLLIK